VTGGKRGRWLLIAVGVAAVLLVLWLRRRSGDVAPAARVAAEPAATTSTPARPQLPARALAPPAAAPAEARAPIIDEVVLEHSEVCEGEENLVTVKAHTPDNHDDAFLHYMVGGQTGNPVVLRAGAERGGHAGVKVIAFGRNGIATTVDLPRFVVKDCKARYALVLTFRLLPNLPAAFEFAARVVPLGASGPLEARRYRWTFGDGGGDETIEPVARHDFSRRPQREMATTFLITCSALGQDGERVQGRTALELHNLAFESFAYKGVVKILVAPEPLFPTLGSDGVVRQRFRLWHPYDHPIRIERLRRSKQIIGVAGRPPETLPASTLGIGSIAPGETVETKPLALDTRAEPDVFSLEYLIEGTTEDGWPATGNLALMRPPALPTKDSGAPPVTDPLLKAKILRARELLGQAYVTDEDIWRLDRQGAFANLTVAPAASTDPPAPPPARPPAPAPQSR
jgi:hypothetical protein